MIETTSWTKSEKENAPSEKPPLSLVQDINFRHFTFEEFKSYNTLRLEAKKGKSLEDNMLVNGIFCM